MNALIFEAIFSEVNLGENSIGRLGELQNYIDSQMEVPKHSYHAVSRTKCHLVASRQLLVFCRFLFSAARPRSGLIRNGLLTRILFTL